MRLTSNPSASLTERKKLNSPSRRKQAGTTPPSLAKDLLFPKEDNALDIKRLSNKRSQINLSRVPLTDASCASYVGVDDDGKKNGLRRGIRHCNPDECVSRVSATIASHILMGPNDVLGEQSRRQKSNPYSATISDMQRPAKKNLTLDAAPREGYRETCPADSYGHHEHGKCFPHQETHPDRSRYRGGAAAAPFATSNNSGNLEKPFFGKRIVQNSPARTPRFSGLGTAESVATHCDLSRKLKRFECRPSTAEGHLHGGAVEICEGASVDGILPTRSGVRKVHHFTHNEHMEEKPRINQFPWDAHHAKTENVILSDYCGQGLAVGTAEERLLYRQRQEQRSREVFDAVHQVCPPVQQQQIPTESHQIEPRQERRPPPDLSLPSRSLTPRGARKAQANISNFHLW